MNRFKERSQSLHHIFYNTYGISKVNLAELIDVEVKVFRRYLDGDEVDEEDRKKIAAAMYILEGLDFRFVPTPTDYRSWTIDERVELHDMQDSCVKEFMELYERELEEDHV